MRKLLLRHQSRPKRIRKRRTKNVNQREGIKIYLRVQISYETGEGIIERML